VHVRLYRSRKLEPHGFLHALSLRVLQRYMTSPLLLHKRKFHIRAYALAVSSLRVYLARGSLALCSGTPYRKNDFNTLSHITNTAFQGIDPHFREDDCVLVWDEATIAPILLKDCTCNTLDEARTRIDGVTSAMQSITGDLFRVYESEFGVFSPIDGCFEHFGLDFLVDDLWNVYLLEANPGPDFKQTGERLAGVVRDLMNSTIDTFFASTEGGLNGQPSEETGTLVCVYDNPNYRRSHVRKGQSVRLPA
jgi:tubulin---tyrosine ligase